MFIGTTLMCQEPNKLVENIISYIVRLETD